MIPFRNSTRGPARLRTVALLLLLFLIPAARCAFLGIPTSRQYGADQARSLLDAALRESILIASAAGSKDEARAERILQNLVLQSAAFEAAVLIESGKVYEKDDVHACADRLRSVGIVLAVASTPEAVGLAALDCDVPAQ